MIRARRSDLKALAAAAAFALVLAACSGSGADVAGNDAGSESGASATSAAPATTAAPAPTTTAAATTTTEAPVEPLDATANGPFTVGHRTVTIAGDPTRGRPLTVDIWYPAADGATGEATRYELLPGVGVNAEAALTGVPAADGTFPLVVYSHGSGGLRYIAASSTEHLASWGFVVAAPDHTGNTALEQILGTTATPEENARNRPADVTQVIDGVIALNGTAGDPLEGSVDAGRVGIFGHSAGGYTSVAAATGLTLPDGSVVAADPRIGAVGLLAPATGRLAAEDLARMTQPFIVIAGTADAVTPIDPNVTNVWASAPGTPRYRIDLTGVGHDIFTDLCRYLEALPSLTAAPEVVVDVITERATPICTPPAPDYRAVHDASDGPMAAFFLAVLGVDADTSARAQATLDALFPAGGELVVAP